MKARPLSGNAKPETMERRTFTLYKEEQSASKSLSTQAIS